MKKILLVFGALVLAVLAAVCFFSDQTFRFRPTTAAQMPQRQLFIRIFSTFFC